MPGWAVGKGEVVVIERVGTITRVIAFVMFFPLRRGDLRTRYAPILWCKENFASVRIFYRGSRRKTDDLDITGFWCKRTGN